MAIARVVLMALAVASGVVALYFAGEKLFEGGGSAPGTGTGERVTETTP